MREESNPVALIGLNLFLQHVAIDQNKFSAQTRMGSNHPLGVSTGPG